MATERSFHVCGSYADDFQNFAKDLDLFRSIPWFREGVTASGIFNDQIHTWLQQTVTTAVQRKKTRTRRN